MKHRKQLFKTPSKVMYEGPEPDSVIQHFRDLQDGDHAGDGRGVLNNRISEYFYQQLDDAGIPTHFVRRLNMREQQLRRVEPLPVAIMIRSVVDGNLAARLGLPRGTRLQRPIVEFMYNDYRLADPIVSEEHIATFGWLSPQDLDEMLAVGTRAHDMIIGMLMACGYRLIDLRLEFGRYCEPQPPQPNNPDEIREEVRIVLCSDLSPDTMRLHDREDSQPLAETGYEAWREVAVESEGGTAMDGATRHRSTVHQEIAARLGLLPQASPIDMQGPSTLQ